MIRTHIWPLCNTLLDEEIFFQAKTQLVQAKPTKDVSLFISNMVQRKATSYLLAADGSAA